MDPEIPQLGPGFEPADPAVRGTDHTVFIEKNRQEQLHSNSGCSHLIMSAFTVLPENFHLIPEDWVWAEPTKNGISANVLFFMQKICSRCILKRILVILKVEGKFDNRKFLKSTANFYISNSYPGKHGLPKTQDF